MVTITFPAEVKQRLEREARQAGKSVSAFIREAVTVRLRRGSAKESLYDDTQDLGGAGRSGRPDPASSREIVQEFGE